MRTIESRVKWRFINRQVVPRLVHPNKAASTLEADYHQKVVMKFQLRERSTGQLMSAHQTFVRLTNLNTKQEIIFVAEADSSLTNKFDLVLNAFILNAQKHSLN